MNNLNQGRPQPGRPVQTVQPGRVKKRGGCWLWLGCGCLAVLLGIALLGVGGFVAYQSGAISLETFLDLVGAGPADMEFDNFRDETVYIYILQLDVASDEVPVEMWLEIDAFDIHSYHVVTPGRYRVDFGLSSDASDLGTCTLTIKSGDQYQFVTLPERIVVNRVNDPPTVGTDLVVATSSLCR